MMKDSSHTLYLFITFSLLLACCIFFVYFGDFDINEGWYSNDIFLISEGKQPYVDFFYHRLPLFIELYERISSFIGISIVNLRVISGLFAMLTISLTYILIRKVANKNLALLGILFYFSSIDILRIYTTVQAYALTSCLLVLSVLIANSQINKVIKFSLIAILIAINQWCRYPIDYLPLAYVIYLFAYNLSDKKTLFVSLSCLMSAHFLLFSIYNSPEFRFDVSYGMFQDVPISTIKELILYKMDWLTYSVRSYFVLILVGGMLTISYAISSLSVKQMLKAIYGNEWLFLSLLLIAGNLSMYLLATSGHPVQMSYVMPLIITAIMYAFKRYYDSYFLQSKFFLSAVFLLIMSLFVNNRNFKLDYKHTHLNTINNVGRKISTIMGTNQKLLVFGPVFGVASSRMLISGLEFDLYGFLGSQLSIMDAERFHLMTNERILKLVEDQEPGAVIVNERFLNPNGMGKKLNKVRGKLLQLLENNYQQMNIEDGFYRETFGNIKIYCPQKKD